MEVDIDGAAGVDANPPGGGGGAVVAGPAGGSVNGARRESGGPGGGRGGAARELPKANSKAPGFKSAAHCRAALRAILDRPGPRPRAPTSAFAPVAPIALVMAG